MEKMQVANESISDKQLTILSASELALRYRKSRNGCAVKLRGEVIENNHIAFTKDNDMINWDPFLGNGDKAIMTNITLLCDALKKDFGNKTIIIEEKSIDEAYENDLQKIKEMAKGKVIYLYKDNLKESENLVRLIYTVRRTILLDVMNNAQGQRIEKSKNYTLENGQDLLKLRFSQNKKMSFAAMATALNKANYPTPSGHGQWAQGNVERIYKRYLKLNNLEETKDGINKPIKLKL